VVLLSFLLLVGILEASETKEEKEQRLREAKIRKNTADSFVVIHYHFKKSERPQPPDEDEYYDYDIDFDGQGTLQKVLTKSTIDIPGVIINKDGDVFTTENYLLPEVIDKITVTGPDGQTLNGLHDRILTKTAGQIIRVTQALPQNWKPLSFVKPPKVLDIKTKLYGIGLYLDTGDIGSIYIGQDPVCYSQGQDEYFYITRADPVRKRNNDSDVPDYFDIGSNLPTVICDTNGLPLGITARNRIELGAAALAWQGADILADTGITRKTGEEQIKERFSKYVYQVKVTFRPPPKEEEEYDMGMYGSFYSRWFERGDEQNEIFVYGLAVEPNLLLLPLATPQELVAGIDTISVQVGDEYFPASFAGVLKEFECTLIKLEQPKLANILSRNAKRFV
jgi:hypothetical protein